MTSRLLLDCDTGIDDALALAWLCATGTVPVAVTTTAGNSTAEQAALNSRAVLSLCGYAGVPVASGSPAPLHKPLVTTPETHGETGLGYAVLPAVKQPLMPLDWRELWQHEIIDRPGETTLLVTGPLTNLAVAIQELPGLLDALGGLVMMGGTFHHPGNTTPTAEWNAWVDPDAAATVYDAYVGRDQLPLVCGLNLTEAVEFPRSTIERWQQNLPSNPACDLVVDALRFYLEFHEQWGYGSIVHVPDLVTAMVATGAISVAEVPAWVGVETASELTRGTTAADIRDLWHKPANARIAQWSGQIPDVAAEFERALRSLIS